MNTKEFLKLCCKHKLIDKNIHKDLSSCIASRGKYKGYLLANCPSDHRKYIWKAMVSYLAPQRAGLMSMMFCPDEDKNKFINIDNLLSTTEIGSMLNAFEPPFRWNLWANRYDSDKAQKIYINYLKDKM